MPNFSTSTITISKKDGNLVVVRKPVLSLPEKVIGYLWQVLKLAILIAVVSGFIVYKTGKVDRTVISLSVVIAAGAVIILTILDKRNPPDEDRVLTEVDKVLRHLSFSHPGPSADECENLTFGADGFTVRYRKTTASFSCRRDARPVLRQCPDDTKQEYADVIIPCSLQDGSAPLDFHGTYYEMPRVKIADAKRILAALKEHLGAI